VTEVGKTTRRKTQWNTYRSTNEQSGKQRRELTGSLQPRDGPHEWQRCA